ncbi:MAG: hypothetical protein ACOCRK_04415 [bacterium]
MLYIFNKIVPDYIANNIKKKSKIFIWRNNASFNNIIYKYKNNINERKRYNRFIKKNIPNEAKIYGNDHIFSISIPFFNKFNTIIEDGLINYYKYDKIKKDITKKY